MKTLLKIYCAAYLLLALTAVWVMARILLG